jgi:6-phosphogluconolactonase
LSEEGTILSLFPGNEENTTTESWVIPVVIAPEEPFRITLTIPVVNSAVVKAFLITGKRKEDIVQQVLNGKYLPERYPAQLIHTAGNTVHWFIDESAAGKIIKPATT